MKKVLIAAVAACALIGLFVWTVAAGPAMPGPDAAELWNHITKVDPYTKWGHWPGFQGMQQTRSPHGPYVKVFVNATGLAIKKPPATYGTIEVKEGYDSDKKLKNITVQYKVKGFNPEAGDWFWVKYTPAGEAGPVGKPRGCVNCHASRTDNDYMLTHFFDN